MLTTEKLKQLEQFFWSKTIKGGENHCWVWTGFRNHKGYGCYALERHSMKAHRISWFLHHRKPLPDGKYVLHSCDNTSCVNPKHLWLGSLKQNMQDCVSKNRCGGKRVQLKLLPIAPLKRLSFKSWLTCPRCGFRRAIIRKLASVGRSVRGRCYNCKRCIETAVRPALAHKD